MYTGLDPPSGGGRGCLGLQFILLSPHCHLLPCVSLVLYSVLSALSVILCTVHVLFRTVCHLHHLHGVLYPHHLLHPLQCVPHTEDAHHLLTHYTVSHTTCRMHVTSYTCYTVSHTTHRMHVTCYSPYSVSPIVRRMHVTSYTCYTMSHTTPRMHVTS